MSKAARAQAQFRQQRRERLGRKLPIAERILKDRAFARMMVECAPFVRVLVEHGLCPTPGLGVENVEAVISLIRDGLGLVTLTDAEFESAIRLSMPAECREAVH